MSRSPERAAPERPAERARPVILATGVALAAALTLGAGQAAAQQATPAPAPPPPPADAQGAVVDIVGEVQSLDGTESEVRRDKTVTVALTSDVLFAFDKADLTAKARQRLQAVADKVKAEAAGGAIRIEGHTDDQGSDAYNQGLSRRRAEAVREALAGLLGGQGGSLQARGFGERRPKVPNLVDGKPNDKNRAKNRRVEIVFDAKQGP